jgi:type I restriction enzyme, S subunit
MSRAWPIVRLGDVMHHRKEFVTIDDLTTYRRPRVKLHVQGIVLRDEVPGALVKTKKQQVCKVGELLVAEIDAKVGGFGIVPKALDRSIVSSHYFLFGNDESRLDRTFLDFFIRTPMFREQVEAQGSTNYAAIRPSDVLNYEIPLPSLAEQRRVVARIEELSVQIHEARKLRQQAAAEADRLLLSHAAAVFSRLSERHLPREFGSFLPHVTSGPRNWAKHYEAEGPRFYRAQDIGPDGSVIDNSKVFIAPPPGAQGRSATLQTGDLMPVITGATVGRAAIFRKGLEPGFVSQHVAICRLPSADVNPEFALWGLRNPIGQAQLLGQRYGQGKPGLNLANIRALRLPVPPLVDQCRVVAELNAVQAEANVLERLQAEAAAELDALLPAVLDRAFKGEL